MKRKEMKRKEKKRKQKEKGEGIRREQRGRGRRRIHAVNFTRKYMNTYADTLTHK